MIEFEQDEKNLSNGGSRARGRTQIIADVLHQCEENKRKSHVMQKANLNFDQVNHYLVDLQSRGLVEPSFTEDGRTYRTTVRGREFLDRYQKLIGLFSGHMGSQRTESNPTAINPVKPIQQKTRSKTLAISFLLAVSLSMIISQGVLLVPSTTETLLLEQQLVHAQEDNNATDGKSELEDAIVSTKDEKETKDIAQSKDEEDVGDNVIENAGTSSFDSENGIQSSQENDTAEGTQETDTIIEPVEVPVLNSNSSKQQPTRDATDREPPDDDCLFDPSLPKCAPIDGECPDGFAMNEDGQCYPNKPCPKGYERRDDDETGTCYSVLEKHLKVIVNVKGADGAGKISVESKGGAGNSRFVDNIQGTHTFKFYKNSMPIGAEFKACAYSDKFGKELCTNGKNGLENAPEKVAISFASNTGLKVIVNVKGTDGAGKVSVRSEDTDDTLVRKVNSVDGKHTFQFKAGEVPIDKVFEACAYSDKVGKELCTKGKNGLENAPERVSIIFQEVPSTGILELTTEKKMYNIRETVTFTIKNNGHQTLEFPNGNYGLQIRNLDTGKNCDRISTAVVTELKPGESIKQNWDQKCGDGKSVKAGKYNAKVASGSLSSDTTFNIRQVLKWN